MFVFGWSSEHWRWKLKWFFFTVFFVLFFLTNRRILPNGNFGICWLLVTAKHWQCYHVWRFCKNSSSSKGAFCTLCAVRFKPKLTLAVNEVFIICIARMQRGFCSSQASRKAVCAFVPRCALSFIFSKGFKGLKFLLFQTETHMLSFLMLWQCLRATQNNPST